ncbi:MAG: hypothetical protein H0U21_07215 [Acidimicrobiia bacterium]|nr:hypothetical protein [Acidimicrobiia bacterium]
MQAGSTAALTAQFSVPNDVGPVTVSIELQGAGALGTLSLDAGVTSSELLNCTPIRAP